MRSLLIAALTCLSVTAPANAQIVVKYSGIQPIEHPSSYAEKYFGEEAMRSLLIAALTCLSVAAANAQVVTKYSGIQPIEHPSSYAEKYFGEEVGTLSKGTIKVEVYHNTQLGDAVANVQSVRNGTIGFTTVSASNLNQVVPAMDMYSLPFLFKNEAHFWWFLAQPQAPSLLSKWKTRV